jgi:hypothetical protein
MKKATLKFNGRNGAKLFPRGNVKEKLWHGPLRVTVFLLN